MSQPQQRPVALVHHNRPLNPTPLPNAAPFPFPKPAKAPVTAAYNNGSLASAANPAANGTQNQGSRR